LKTEDPEDLKTEIACLIDAGHRLSHGVVSKMMMMNDDTKKTKKYGSD